MTDKFAEVKAQHAEQIASILSETHPSLTPGQIAEIQKQAANVVGDWQISPLLRISNEIILLGLIGQNRSLVREVPSAAQVRDHLLKLRREDFGEYVGAAKEVEIAREVAAMSDDAKLSACPVTAQTEIVQPSALETLEARNATKKLSPAEQEELDDKWLIRNFGPNYAPHILDPRKRKELLDKRDATSNQGLRADAQRIDNMAVRFGADASDDSLSAQDSIARHRAKQALAKRA